jgi:hexokinase
VDDLNGKNHPYEGGGNQGNGQRLDTELHHLIQRVANVNLPAKQPQKNLPGKQGQISQPRQERNDACAKRPYHGSIVFNLVITDQIWREIRPFYDTQVYRTLANEFFDALTSVRAGLHGPPSYHRSYLGRPVTVFPGTYGAIDVGGSHVRLAVASVSQNHEVTIISSKKDPVPDAKTVPEFFSWIAERFLILLAPYSDVSNVGFTFSYPMQTLSANRGWVQRWTKSVHLPTSPAVDPARSLVQAMAQLGRPVRVAALLNDTVAAGIAGGHDVDMGLVLGTGFNLSLYDTDLGEFINLEVGQCNSPALQALTTSWDRRVDLASANPGQQVAEKQVGGLYLGQLAGEMLGEPMTASDVANCDAQLSPCSTEIADLCRAIRFRAAGITLSFIRGAAKALGKSNVTVSVDGSLFAHYNAFRLQLENVPDITWLSPPQPSLVGAVLAAATQTHTAGI